MSGRKAMSCGDCTHEPSDCSTNAVSFCACDPCGAKGLLPDGCGNHVTGSKEYTAPLEANPDKADEASGTDTTTVIMVKIDVEVKVSPKYPNTFPISRLCEELDTVKKLTTEC